MSSRQGACEAIRWVLLRHVGTVRPREVLKLPGGTPWLPFAKTASLPAAPMQGTGSINNPSATDRGPAPRTLLHALSVPRLDSSATFAPWVFISIRERRWASANAARWVIGAVLRRPVPGSRPCHEWHQPSTFSLSQMEQDRCRSHERSPALSPAVLASGFCSCYNAGCLHESET